MQVRELAAKVFNHRVSNAGECPTIAQWIEDKTLKSEPKDPWGHALVMVCPSEHDAGGADVVSLGPDGRSDTKDDIVSWQ
jgi:hypothetical protein